MEWKQACGILSVVLTFINQGLYATTVIKGKTRPHAFSWLLWALVMEIVFAAQYANEAGAGAWQIGISGLLCLAIGILALSYGERRGTLTDWLAILTAISAIPLWIVTKDALASVILLTVIDGLGYYPTLRKSYHRPYEENIYRPFRSLLTFSATLLAVEHYNLTTVFYPAGVMTIEFILGVILLWRRRAVLSSS